MRRIASLRVALLLSAPLWLLACGEDNGETPVLPSGGAHDAAIDPSSSSPDPTPPARDAETSADASDGKDAGQEAGAGSKADAGPVLTLEIPKAEVSCGASACATLDNVCCESWSKDAGFAGQRSCITREQCNREHTRSGEQNRAVVHECDGKEDCSGGQVCCFYAYGAPLCELADLLECTTKLTGPGGSRSCADNDGCKLGTVIVGGTALGLLSCTEDSDCQDRPGTRCQAEQDDSATTGKGAKARSYVKVCR
jgi:hypothetical protein